MPRKKTGRRRGRPVNPHARRGATTRRGRRGLPELVDEGSSLLRQRKRQATTREDVELTPAGILYGHGHLDNAQYSAFAYLTLLLRQVAGAMGGNLSVAGLWQSMLAAASRGHGSPPALGDAGARDRLARICERLGSSRGLVIELAAEQHIPPICVRAAERRLTPHDQVRLELLRKGLDGISAPGWWAAEA